MRRHCAPASTAVRSARRVMARARWIWLAAAEPPGRMKLLSGARFSLRRSIATSSLATWPGIAGAGTALLYASVADPTNAFFAILALFWMLIGAVSGCFVLWFSFRA